MTLNLCCTYYEAMKDVLFDADLLLTSGNAEDKKLAQDAWKKEAAHFWQNMAKQVATSQNLHHMLN